jgi:hypothetical protein
MFDIVLSRSPLYHLHQDGQLGWYGGLYGLVVVVVGGTVVVVVIGGLVVVVG